jgi:hypothetical protein
VWGVGAEREEAWTMCCTPLARLAYSASCQNTVLDPRPVSCTQSAPGCAGVDTAEAGRFKIMWTVAIPSGASASSNERRRLGNAGTTWSYPKTVYVDVSAAPAGEPTMSPSCYGQAKCPLCTCAPTPSSGGGGGDDGGVGGEGVGGGGDGGGGSGGGKKRGGGLTMHPTFPPTVPPTHPPTFTGAKQAREDGVTGDECEPPKHIEYMFYGVLGAGGVGAFTTGIACLIAFLCCLGYKKRLNTAQKGLEALKDHGKKTEEEGSNLIEEIRLEMERVADPHTLVDEFADQEDNLSNLDNLLGDRDLNLLDEDLNFEDRLKLIKTINTNRNARTGDNLKPIGKLLEDTTSDINDEIHDIDAELEEMRRQQQVDAEAAEAAEATAT